MSQSGNIKYKEFEVGVGNADFSFFTDENIVVEQFAAKTPVHAHEFFELFYVLRGNVNIHTNDRVLKLAKGDCAIIGQGMLHVSEVCENSQRIVISFIVEKNVKKAKNNFYDEFKELFSEKIISFENFSGGDAFVRLSRYYHSDFKDRSELVISCLHEMVVLLKTMAEQSGYDDGEEILSDSDNYRRYIIDNYFQNELAAGSLIGLARTLHLSPQQTQRVVKKIYGITFTQRMNFIRMRRAKSLLETTDFKISKIANECGYLSTNTFFAVFKKSCGLTPNEYRKEKTR